MKIVMFAINPLYPDRIIGGAAKHLQNIAIHLGEKGHRVTILCTTNGQKPEFKWHDNVTIYPTLPFHQPFPMPYAIPAFVTADIIKQVAEQLTDADRFYMHDGEFLFPDAYRSFQVPTVVSLRDTVYPETLLGSYHFKGDSLVLISNYSRLHTLQTVGRFYPHLDGRIQVIHNGLDWSRFRPGPTDRIRQLIPLDPQDILILHPHRPEETKGLRQTVEVIDRLVHQYGLHNVKALAPKWLDSQLTPELAAFYDEIQSQIDARGLAGNFLFHDWIPESLMQEYYNLGAVTLALGSFVEAFGNAVYESLGCGTPSIAARVSTHREILPDGLLDKVDFNDNDKAAEIAAQIIREGRRTSAETMAYLHDRYSIERQLAGYEEVIVRARRLPDLAFRFEPIGETTRFVLPVWCYLSRYGIYNDFSAAYLEPRVLTDLIRRFPTGFSTGDAVQAGASRLDVRAWLRDGFITPVWKG